MSSHRPPRWARVLVEALARGPHREFVLGDLEELHARRRARGSAMLATATYLVWGIRSGLGDTLGPLWPGLAGDVRYVLRQLRAHPRVYLGAALVLAVGLGMRTFSWGMEYGAFGHGLPVTWPDRMVAVEDVNLADGRVQGFSKADLEILRQSAGTLDGIALWGVSEVTLDDADHAPARVRVLLASASLFDLLELSPRRGRALTEADGEAGAPPVAMLGHRLWTRRYGGDPGVVGRILRIDGVPTTVVGVLPPGPTFQGEDLWLPIAGERRDARSWAVLARTASGTSPRDAGAVLKGLGTRLETTGSPTRARLELRVVPFTESFREPGSPGDRHARVMTRGGWLLLLMALANAVNLFLVRTRHRARELAVRRALGAGRTRILRQLSLEIGVSTAIGTLGGALLAFWGLAWFQAAQNAYVGGATVSWQRWDLGWPHVTVLAAAGLVSALVISVVVGIASRHTSHASSLRWSRGATPRFRVARALVALEIAGGGALFLLASLMIRSAWNLRTTDWGFGVDRVMTGHVVLSGPDTATFEARLRLWDELQRELGGVPGVESATLGTQLPMIRYAGQWGAWRRVEVEGRDVADPSEIPGAYVDAVTSTFLRTFQVGVVAGRAFGSEDDGNSEPVAIVNTDFVRAWLAEGEPLGRRIRVWKDGTAGPWRTVVGVAPNLWMDTDEDQDPQGVYVPVAQTSPTEASLAIRVRGDPEAYADAVQRVVRRLLPGVPVTDLQTMSQLIRYRTRLYRRDGPLFVGLGVGALLLAVAGLYAVISYVASVRMAEFGIRAALGASRPRLVRRAVLWGVPTLAAGIPAGVAIGLWLTRGFARFMFLVDPWSPGVAVAGFGILALTALSASLVPALRAGRVDVVRVLNCD